MRSSIIMAEISRTLRDIEDEKFVDEGVVTTTSEDQIRVENLVERQFDIHDDLSELGPDALTLYKNKHVLFLKKSLCNLAFSYQCLDSSRPWLCYWILHSLELLQEEISKEEKSNVAQFLKRCQSSEGGFGGGPGQMPHLAPTYAAINALAILGTEEAYSVINREKLLEFLWSIKLSNGAFQIHKNGEIDIRAVYCAASIARLTNTYCEDLFENSAEWVASCQTYEGGFAGTPGVEAHGGYAFCGLAALALLKKEHLCDIKSFLRWGANRQMRLEGGFQGRTNKLVDVCYSFWQGGAFPLVHQFLSKSEERYQLDTSRWLFNQEALQEYILCCCQNASGGLVDKPGKPRDVYHTCYALSGLSVAQHSGDSLLVVGSRKNQLAPIHPLFNIGVDAAIGASLYFKQLSVPKKT